MNNIKIIKSLTKEHYFKQGNVERLEGGSLLFINQIDKTNILHQNYEEICFETQLTNCCIVKKDGQPFYCDATIATFMFYEEGLPEPYYVESFLNFKPKKPAK